MHRYICRGGCFRFPDRELEEMYRNLYQTKSADMQHRLLVLDFTHIKETNSFNDQGFRVFVTHRVALPFDV